MLCYRNIWNSRLYRAAWVLYIFPFCLLFLFITFHSDIFRGKCYFFCKKNSISSHQHFHDEQIYSKQAMYITILDRVFFLLFERKLSCKINLVSNYMSAKYVTLFSYWVMDMKRFCVIWSHYYTFNPKKRIENMKSWWNCKSFNEKLKLAKYTNIICWKLYVKVIIKSGYEL